jgi:hypothetical protein
MGTFGFIITRHVNSEQTNNYWNHSVKLLNTFYPNTKIVIIDDNSNQDLVKAEFEYPNVEVIQSEFPGRGELLPYYYYIKNKFFDNAVIIHDSVFFHTKINFEKLEHFNVMPLWHFDKDKENSDNTIRIASNLRNFYVIKDKLASIEVRLKILKEDNWYGCFGCQSFINHNFLMGIENKYGLTNLIRAVKCRKDRCCLERIMGCIFFTDNSKIAYQKSLFGKIQNYLKWGYTFNEYQDSLKKGTILKPVIKVWTGR